MSASHLQGKIDASGSALSMLRAAPGRGYAFPMTPEFTTWRDEQAAWSQSAVLFDQSFHMTEVSFTGPEVRQLFSDVGANTFASFGAGQAKRYVACAPDGHLIGDAILFGLRDDRYTLVGIPVVPDWLEFNAVTGGYDVEVTRDERTVDSQGARRHFRFQVQGPRALEIVERAIGGPLPEIAFFRIGELELAGCRLQALNHTMTGVPGVENTGLELWGPREDGPRVHEALLRAGEAFGMRQGGAVAYSTTPIESGWLGRPVPAIYSGDEMRAYREFLGADGYEGRSSLRGSLPATEISDFYVTPYELGYDRSVRFDHDFIGREALEASRHDVRRRQVWLRWNDDDAAEIHRRSLFGEGDRPRRMEVPFAAFATYQFDAVLDGDAPVGISGQPYYTETLGCWATMAVIDEALAHDGQELEVVWGQAPDAQADLGFDQHVQTQVRATVSTSAPVHVAAALA